MGVVQLRQIRSYLEANFAPHVDVADYVTRPEEDRKNAVLTRSLAAFALTNAADISVEVAAGSIVDGFNDNGIDAIYYAADDRVLYLCQSKWSNDGTGSLDLAGAEKFIRGVKDLLNLRLDRFNEKIRTRKSGIEEAINTTVKVHLIIVYSGSERLGDHPRRVLDDLLAELNDTGEVANLEVVAQEKLHTVVSMGGRGDPVDIVIQLFDWGQTKAPYQAFYGQVAASDVAQWGAQFRHRIFSKNIRSFLGGSTAVNEGIAESVRKTPNQFWYLNNGITALCTGITKRAIGGNSREAGTFECRGVAIVNGAQTVGTITELGVTAVEQLANARVPIRLISLEGCPPEFANEVTRATNTQNRVDSRNFVALDPEQNRLRSELLVDGIDYEYRQGEGEPSGEKRFGLVDATVALACSSATVDLAVQAKREISKLWEDLSRPPYKLMFNSGLTGLKLWHLVQILREVDALLEFERAYVEDPKFKSILINGNRSIAHAVFRNFVCSDIGSASFNLYTYADQIEGLFLAVCDEMYDVIENQYNDLYLAPLFKNATKCKEISFRVGAVTVTQEIVDRIGLRRNAAAELAG